MKHSGKKVLESFVTSLVSFVSCFCASHDGGSGADTNVGAGAGTGTVAGAGCYWLCL
jgi:hypothetical protein